MRTRHWLAAFTSGWLALAGVSTAIAQQPPFSTNGNPDQSGWAAYPAPLTGTYGPMPSPAYGPMPNTTMNQPGYPPGANPWPSISPFYGPPYNQTINENGFWYNKLKFGDRQYYGSINATYSHTTTPQSRLIGAQGVNPISNDIFDGRLSNSTTATTFNGTSTTFVSGITQFNQNPSGTGPRISSGSSSSTTSTTGSSGTTTGATGTTTGSTGTSGAGTGTTGTTTATPPIFPAYSTGILPGDLNAAGVLGTWGWWNTDDTGFMASGFFQGQSGAQFNFNDPLLNLNILSPNYNPSLHLHAWFGLPLAGADTDGTNNGAIADGAVVPYDMGVHISFTTQLAGIDTSWYFEPIYDQGLIKVRTTAGAKYIRLQEHFQFDGYDSGMGYTVGSGSSGTGTTGSSGTTSGSTTGSTTGSGSGSGTGTSGGGFLTPSGFQAGFAVPDVIHSQLNSSTLANMGGPEFGFRIDMGSKNFQLWLQTKTGALVNVSQRNVNGYNIGNAFNIIAGNTVPAMPNDPSLTYFNHNYTSATMSPMFEQQVNTKFPIFSVIPYLNKINMFERAQFTAGYTFLWLGSVYRPNGDVDWNQTVVNTQNVTGSTGVTTTTSTVGVTPQLNGHRSDFFNSMFNIGLEWTY